jgi:hypothetical protein
MQTKTCPVKRQELPQVVAPDSIIQFATAIMLCCEWCGCCGGATSRCSVCTVLYVPFLYKPTCRLDLPLDTHSVVKLQCGQIRISTTPVVHLSRCVAAEEAHRSALQSKHCHTQYINTHHWWYTTQEICSKSAAKLQWQLQGAPAAPAAVATPPTAIQYRHASLNAEHQA